MPGSLVTIERRDPVSRLNSVDLPTFGRPTITIDACFSLILILPLARPFLLCHPEPSRVFPDGVRDLHFSCFFTSAGRWRDDSTRIVILRRTPFVYRTDLPWCWF